MVDKNQNLKNADADVPIQMEQQDSYFVEGIDDIDFKRYKGHHIEAPNFKIEGESYECPLTGAHFDFDDMAERLSKV